MRAKLFLVVLCLFAGNNISIAQETRPIPKPKPNYRLKKAVGPIKVDGRLDEADWQLTEIAGDFFANNPADTSYALSKTEARLTYDDNFLYVGAVCYDPVPGEYIVESLRRDYDMDNSDGFSIYLDPFDDGVNGFAFGVNPYGAQREGLLQNGGGFGLSLAWDNRWFSKVVRYEDRWVVEMAIPFKTLRFNDDVQQWGLNFMRNDQKQNERSTWAAVPRNFNVTSLAFTGKLLWDELPPATGPNISIIPSTIMGMSQDFDAEDKEIQTKPNASLDAKVAVTSSLNLDLTVNPDFSQVDVDVQQTNLTRFSLFFPERRNFFLENSDLFGRFGFSQIRPFFSRRIGLNNGRTVPIMAGARLSGKLDKNWRIGLMNLQTEGDTTGLQSQNYTVAAFQRQVWGRSTIGGIFVNRQGFENPEIRYQDYNRIAGLDFNLASNDNKWRGKAFYHQAFTPEDTNNSYAHATWLRYGTRTWEIDWNHEFVGANYLAEVGFVPRNTRYDADNNRTVRTTFWRLEPRVTRFFYPKSSIINWHGPTVYVNHYTDENFETTDLLIQPRYEVSFLNTSWFQVSYDNRFTRLLFNTDVTFDDNPTIPAGRYHYRNVTAQYGTDQRKLFKYFVTADYGSYYVGEKFTYTVEAVYRVQPWGIFSLNLRQNFITMPEEYTDAQLTLLGARTELSFTKSLFLTAFVQYNTQADNLNFNTRFQWRYKPMSDLFIVYTDNYDPQLNVKNRALVLKFVYWLTL